MKKLVLFYLLSVLSIFSCKKEEPIEEYVVEQPEVEEIPDSVRIEFSEQIDSNYTIKLNSVEQQEKEFQVESGDTVHVQVINNCWMTTYYGLGDTVGTLIQSCNIVGISLYLNNSQVAGAYCDAPFPYTCPVTYLNYIVD